MNFVNFLRTPLDDSTSAICVATVNDEYTKSRFKGKFRVTFKDKVCVKLCLKLWFESNCFFLYYCWSLNGYEIDCPESSKKSFFKVSLKK